jgi:hypothetical protein
VLKNWDSWIVSVGENRYFVSGLVEWDGVCDVDYRGFLRVKLK